MEQGTIRAAQRAGRRMADRSTPFVENCWYVAGFAAEFDHALRARTILGHKLVLFRTEEGVPVALADRCVHRSFPLSASRLDGDTIICGYHGLQYRSDGVCIGAPMLAECPRGLAVRSYPTRSQGPLVWIWMGDAAPNAELPLGDWVADEAWPSSQQYYHLPASYIALHENLLDLSHLSFLHAGSFGTPDYAAAPYEVVIDEAGGRFRVTRSVIPTRLPPVWGEPTGLMGRDAARISTSDFLSPAAHVVTARFHPLDVPPEQRLDTRIMTAHLATPETPTTTHYFIHHGRNFAQDDPTVTGFMQHHLTIAFTEDVDGLTAVEQMVDATPPDDYFEISLASDRPGVAMRRWLLKTAQAEAESRQVRVAPTMPLASIS